MEPSYFNEHSYLVGGDWLIIPYRGHNIQQLVGHTRFLTHKEQKKDIIGLLVWTHLYNPKLQLFKTFSYNSEQQTCSMLHVTVDSWSDAAYPIFYQPNIAG